MKSNQQEEEPFNIVRDNRDLSISKITRSPNENTISLLPRPEEQRILRDSWLKWMALSLTCMINFALNYSSNNPQALQPSIEEFFQIGDAKFNLLYSVYSMPNIILPFVGGFLTDFLGVRFAVNVFGFIVIIGQGVFTYGTYQEDFDMMVIGRFIFGLGGESLTVSQLPFLAKWFSGTKLAFAWGFAKAAVRLGKAANSFLTPKFYLWSNILAVPLLVGLGISTAAWIGSLFLSYIDEKADQQGHRTSNSEGDKKKSLISCRDIKNLPFIFYLFLLSYACLFGSFIGVSNNLNNILVTRFGFDMNDAGNLVMAYYLVSAIAGPFVGLLIENYGRRTILMLIMTIILLVTNIMFAFLPDGSEADPNYAVAFPLIGISIFSSFYTILVWPCIPLVVEKKVIGTATGLITCMSNLMLTLLPMMVGVIHDKTIGFHFGYFWTEIAFSGVVLVGLLLDYWIHIEDARKGSKLDKAKKSNPVAPVEVEVEQDNHREPNPELESEISVQILKSEEEAEAQL